MSEFGDQLKQDLADANAADAMIRCRELFDRFDGRSQRDMTFADQALMIEAILDRCEPYRGGDHELMIVTRLDAGLLAGLAATAFRLRRMTGVEADIRNLVVGK